MRHDQAVTDEPDLATLRTRVAALEAENAELRRRTEAAVDRETRQARKLDELGLDLNGVMQRRGAEEFRSFVRGTRWFYRLLRWQLPKKLRDFRSGRRLKSS